MQRLGATIILTAAAAVLLAAAMMMAGARADPVVRRASVSVRGWPVDAPPVRVLVWSDIHVGNPATDRRRLARLAMRANALRPDLVLLGGDLVAGHDRADARNAAALAPLAGLRARFGTVAVLGNHDHWTDAAAVRAALRRAGVVVLANSAIRRGPIAVGGLDDAPTGRADPAATRAAVRRVGGVPLLLAHSPEVPGGWRGLVVAGHTHCGQIVLPWWGPPVEVTAPRYRCGIVREARRTTIVTAGTGTSVVPLRLGAPPDWWLLSLGPPAGRRVEKPGSAARLPFHAGIGTLDGYSLRVPRRGALLWNGQSIDAVVLKDYLRAWATLPREAGRLFVAFEPGVAPARAAGVRAAVIASGLCRQRRCAEVGWRVERPVVNRPAP